MRKRFHFPTKQCKLFSSNETKEWFKGIKSTVLEWPGLSPNLNLVENVWGIMVRIINAKVKKYDTVAQSSIIEA